jgi:very-short-patch-repair endonuclease
VSEIDVFHSDKIRFESNHYFSYFNNIRIHPDYLHSEKIMEMVSSLNAAFQLETVEIYSLNEMTGKRHSWYRRQSSGPLPVDTDRMPLYQLRMHVSPKDKQGNIHPYTRENMMFENFLGGFKLPQDQWLKFFNTYFEPRRNFESRRIDLFEKSWSPQPKYLKKQSGGKQWGLVHENAYGSPIEEELGEALKTDPSLKALNITVLQQEEIYHQGILLTRPDFLIPEARLVIYCDGFQYHYNKEAVIKDRTQDRKLQFMGYRVLRYTGSEIKGKLFDCVQEIGHFVQRFRNKD